MPRNHIGRPTRLSTMSERRDSVVICFGVTYSQQCKYMYICKIIYHLGIMCWFGMLLFLHRLSNQYIVLVHIRFDYTKNILSLIKCLSLARSSNFKAMRWEDLLLPCSKLELLGGIRTTSNVIGTDKWVIWTMIIEWLGSCGIGNYVGILFWNTLNIYIILMDHYCIPAKAPISWVNVPLWEFGDDGWTEVPTCLAMVHLF